MSEAPTTGQALVAETLGTFVLVLFGVGAALMSGGDYVATGLSFGVAMLVMAYALGRISGAHFNPAISLGAALDGRVSWPRAGLYALVQLAGALLAGATLWVLMHGFPGFSSVGHFGQNSFGAAGSGFAWWAAFLIEALMTALLVGVVLAVTDSRNENGALAPLAIGLTLAVIHFASMAATATSVNPARSIGVGVFAGTDAIAQLWLFILAPLLGGVLAGATYSVVLGRGQPAVPRSGLRLRRPKPAIGGYAPSPVYQPQWRQGHPQQWSQPAAGYPGQWHPEPPGREPGPVNRPPAGLRPIHPSQRKDTERPESRPRVDLPPATQQPWTPQDWAAHMFPPPPNEPYWSQQLPEEWGASGDDEDGRTQIRPPAGG